MIIRICPTVIESIFNIRNINYIPLTLCVKWLQRQSRTKILSKFNSMIIIICKICLLAFVVMFLTSGIRSSSAIFL